MKYKKEKYYIFLNRYNIFKYICTQHRGHQYIRASLVAQMVKNPPAMWEGDLGLILGLEDPLQEGMATHSNIHAWRIPLDRGAWQVHRIAQNQT